MSPEPVREFGQFQLRQAQSFESALTNEVAMKTRVQNLAVSIAIAISPSAGLAQSTVEKRFALDQPPLVNAHRAHCGGEPENSLSAIQCAIDRGIDMVELDVQMTRDEGYVLMHDSSLKRMTNAQEVFPDGSPQLNGLGKKSSGHYIRDYTIKDIQKIRLVGSNGDGYPVPTLEMALELAKGRIIPFLHLKTFKVESLVPLLEAYGVGNVVIWDAAMIVHRQLGPSGFAASFDIAPDPQALQRLFDQVGSDLAVVEVDYRDITPEFRTVATELGIRIGYSGHTFGSAGGTEDLALKNGDKGPWNAAIESGATVLMTDQPEALMDLLGR